MKKKTDSPGNQCKPKKETNKELKAKNGFVLQRDAIRNAKLTDG